MIPLYEVVDHIAGETGIQFNVSPQIGDVQVSASIRSNDWQEAVSKLIKSYSRVEVWTDDLRTTRIWLHDSTLNNEPSENMHSNGESPGSGPTEPGQCGVATSSTISTSKAPNCGYAIQCDFRVTAASYHAGVLTYL